MSSPRNSRHCAAAPDTTKQCTRFARELQFKDLLAENAILRRVVYKNLNQHRSSPSFREVIHISRIIKRISRLRLSSTVACLNNVPQHVTDAVTFASHPEQTHNTQHSTSEDVERSNSVADAVATDDTAFSRSPVYIFLKDLHDAELLLRSLIYASKKAFLGFQAYVEKTYFMSTSLVFMSSAAKIRDIAEKAILIIHDCKSYTASLIRKQLQVLHPSLPIEGTLIIGTVRLDNLTCPVGEALETPSKDTTVLSFSEGEYDKCDDTSSNKSESDAINDSSSKNNNKNNNSDDDEDAKSDSSWEKPAQPSRAVSLLSDSFW